MSLVGTARYTHLFSSPGPRPREVVRLRSSSSSWVVPSGSTRHHLSPVRFPYTVGSTVLLVPIPSPIESHKDPNRFTSGSHDPCTHHIPLTTLSPLLSFYSSHPVSTTKIESLRSLNVTGNLYLELVERNCNGFDPEFLLRLQRVSVFRSSVVPTPVLDRGL